MSLRTDAVRGRGRHRLRPNGADDWLPDDVAFGLGPVRPGDVRLGKRCEPADCRRDRLRCRRGGSRLGPAATGTGERTIRARSAARACRPDVRTPTFTVTHGKVFYLVKGDGRAYAAVG